MSVLVTGGAGYIGSHVVRMLRARGDRVVVADDLSTGHASRVLGTPLVRVDLATDGAVSSLERMIVEHDVDSVVHFAAAKQVAESTREPTAYFRRNVGSLTNLLAAVEATGVRRLVFSSSAAVYGNVAGRPVRESEACAPVNPYGQSKLVGEWMTRNSAAAAGVGVANLRYFNVAGAGWADLRDPGAANLIPITLDTVLAGGDPVVFGDDHGTPDGSCIRDYVHVSDLAEAHLAALDALDEGPLDHTEYNIGTGSGASVLEVLDVVADITGRDIRPVIAPPRAGDPAAVVADTSRAQQDLNWRARHDLHDIVRSAWESLPVNASTSGVRATAA